MFLRRRRSLDDQDDAASFSTDDQTLLHRNSERDDNDFFRDYLSDEPQQRRRPSWKQVVSVVVLTVLLLLVALLYGQDFVVGSATFLRQKQQATGSSIRGEPSARDYQYWSSQEIHQTLLEWNTSTYPSMVHVTSAQERYSLPTPGTARDCRFDTTTTGCQTWILSIQVPTSASSEMPTGQQRSKPQVFLSGALHGDERVGPTVVMETAALLLQVAKIAEVCPANTLQLPLISPCRSLVRKLEQHWGISKEQRQWLLRLVQTRHILMIPTANALGYFRNVREEGSVDPNRDFPYDIEEHQGCLQSVAARSIVSLLQDKLVQLGLTFHAGTEAIAYEWGAYSHLVDRHHGTAPDVVSQRQMAQACQQFSATHSNDEALQQSLYPIGTMNELVYPVHGGMEDWGYAASWDTASVATDCSGEPSSSHSLNVSSTATLHNTNDASFRIFTALVETSHDKQPVVDTLGRSDQVLIPRSSGYINRNMRLSLAMLDLVEPYVAIDTADDAVLRDSADFNSCPANKVVTSLDRESIDITWRVGGAVTVQETRLIYGTKSQLGDELWSYCHSDATQPLVPSQLQDVILTTPFQTGTTQWHTHGGETIFRATVDLSTQRLEPVRVFAVARVDADWNGGETHVARVRTDPNWVYQSSSGATVQGRLEWFSAPLTIERG